MKVNVLIYDKRIKLIRTMEIWQVHGPYIRSNLDIEFTNMGHHYIFPKLIPKGQIWLDEEHGPDEEEFFIRNMLVEYNLMKAGIPFDSAHDVAIEEEFRLRQLRGLTDKTDPKISIMKIYSMSPTFVWLVDGRKVRDHYDIDFTEGGHGLVYDWIPKNEIWIDDDLNPSERKYVLAHERFEWKKMDQGMEYDDAHEAASKAELQMRRKDYDSVIQNQNSRRSH